MKKITLAFFSLTIIVFLNAQDTTLNGYVGKYKFPEGSMVPEVDITLTDSVLTITASIGSATMDKVSKDTFTIPSYNSAMVYFKRNTDGKVTDIKIETSSGVLEGKKEDGAVALNYRHRFLDKKIPVS